VLYYYNMVMLAFSDVILLVGSFDLKTAINSQEIVKDVKTVPEMTYNVSSGMLNVLHNTVTYGNSHMLLCRCKKFQIGNSRCCNIQFSVNLIKLKMKWNSRKL